MLLSLFFLKALSRWSEPLELASFTTGGMSSFLDFCCLRSAAAFGGTEGPGVASGVKGLLEVGMGEREVMAVSSRSDMLIWC